MDSKVDSKAQSEADNDAAPGMLDITDEDEKDPTQSVA